ncbi:lipoprotein-anchoring transpeptidase ErfK/SrfK [Frigoribacterium sp. PhB24]|nr:lipoprotein-anchoring transpeptidase ErfK/SrfK [Frigoribacterium sp. PhB24]
MAFTAIVAAVLLAGCSSTDETAPTATTPAATTSPEASPSPAPSTGGSGDAGTPVPASTTIATADVARISVSSTPGGPTTTVLEPPRPSGTPLVFRVVEQRGDDIEVDLAQRPNGSTGWVRASDVTLNSTSYALVVSTSSNELSLFDAGALVDTYPAATGTGGTPTPLGDFYLTELLAPTNEGYGPYAYGLSAFSDVLNSFGGGPGQIGLHGTDDAASVGRSASHGCIRLLDADITTLAGMLPLGTPILIR